MHSRPCFSPETLRDDTERNGSIDDDVSVDDLVSVSSENMSENEREIHENQDSENCVRFLLANARSLAPKITSLIDSIYDLKCDFAMITETWFRGGKRLDAELSDIEHAAGIKFVCKNRRGRKAGGGVAIAYNAARCNLKKKPIKTCHEITCAVGKIAKIHRKFAIFTVYIPPKTKVNEMAQLCNDISDAIADVKTSLGDPVIIIGGDFNNRDISPAFIADANLELVRSGPTRSGATLDQIYTNSPACLVTPEAEIYPPLESEEGLASDHKCVFASLRFEKVRDFEWIKTTVRLRSAQRDLTFCDELRSTDWEFLRPLCVDGAVRAFETRMDDITNRHFPFKTFRRRSNEWPWITNAIRKKSKKKKRLYRRGGRSRAWRRLTADLEKETRQSKEDYIDKAIEKGEGGRDFFAAVKNLSKPNSAAIWSVTDLFPGRTDEEVGKEVIDYFSSVGGDDAPLIDEPNLDHVPPNISLRVDEVRKRLGNIKKTDSYVPGDPLPHLVRGHPDLFAAPVTVLFNKAFAEGKWPDAWKTENITVIPKVKNPSSLGETRNISCTALLSKVLEGVMLEHLRAELRPDPDQYGGLKGCGAEHLLVDIWESALETLDDGKSAAVLLGVDYQKAFNRMEFSACLNQLKKLGASPGSLTMVKSFLEGRSMVIRIGDVTSAPRAITRGSPQGSVMGCALYCATTQNLCDPRPPAVLNTPRVGPHNRVGPLEVSFDSPGPARIPAERGGRIRFFHGDDSSSSEDDIRFWEAEPSLAPAGNALGRTTSGVGSFKYIDDTTFVHNVSLANATRHITTGTTVETIDLEELEKRFESLRMNAKEIGMMINCNKTQLLCLSPNNGCRTTGSLGTEEGQVAAVESLKLVGFVFGSSPDVSAHMGYLQSKFRAKVWLLYHLREAGIKGERLFRMFCIYIRSVLEYCSPVYHSMMSIGQAEQLESLQRHAARVCFGNDRPIRIVMEERGIESLAERRLARTDKFIIRAVNDPRFGSWFQTRQEDAYNLRDRRAFFEAPARTSRLFNSPRHYFVRRANELGLRAGQ